MSKSTLTFDNDSESIALNIVAGAGNDQNNTYNSVKVGSGKTAASWCSDKHYRRLAHYSIICGCSCIGIKALEKSFEAERTIDQDAAAKLSRRSRKLSIISIVTLVCILLSVPILTVFISYLVTLKE